MTLRKIWARLVATKYTGALEREVARLRAENRALLNSILGIAGVPPIVVAADDLSTQAAANISVEKAVPGRSAAAATERGPNPHSIAESAPPAANSNRIAPRGSAKQSMQSVAAPMRRRSWHQIYRMLEIDAARKKEAV